MDYFLLLDDRCEIGVWVRFRSADQWWIFNGVLLFLILYNKNKSWSLWYCIYLHCHFRNCK